ncbi:hypothetical protein LBMAG56_36200 [Verrucomicrobiota bacterium]|nr:hypothetical protein LBMAG56_36200 [Verrucomicrobiota bacterium]
MGFYPTGSEDKVSLPVLSVQLGHGAVPVMPQNRPPNPSAATNPNASHRPAIAGSDETLRTFRGPIPDAGRQGLKPALQSRHQFASVVGSTLGRS